jgi:hypothetical protein
MGVNKRCLGEIKKGIAELNMPYEEMKMGEFGAQRLVRKTFKHHPDFKTVYKDCATSKQYFEKLGVDHTSFDLTGQFGCVHMDLSKIHEEWKGKFDLLTDCGTSEHVRGGQYEVFANAHNFVREGGVMYHVNPVVGRMLKMHTPELSVYYHSDFYENLAELNGYRIIETKTVNDKKRLPGGLTVAIFQKVNNDQFCSREDFWNIKGIKDYSKNRAFTKERLEYVDE